ncbi:hypothetical protein CDD83_1946 [Cordyceps sp. RAO-2017]|nr:hypothetical protein CDD83_1946 [Cordyceps sp. RAO-2017]
MTVRVRDGKEAAGLQAITPPRRRAPRPSRPAIYRTAVPATVLPARLPPPAGLPQPSASFYGPPRPSASPHNPPKLSASFHSLPRPRTSFPGLPQSRASFHGLPGEGGGGGQRASTERPGLGELASTAGATRQSLPGTRPAKLRAAALLGQAAAAAGRKLERARARTSGAGGRSLGSTRPSVRHAGRTPPFLPATLFSEAIFIFREPPSLVFPFRS